MNNRVKCEQLKAILNWIRGEEPSATQKKANERKVEESEWVRDRDRESKKTLDLEIAE